MPYDEACEIIRQWMDVYSPPKEMEEALEIAMLALKRCDYMDTKYDKKAKGRKKNETAI